ncbi:MAG: hypothetical protein GY910_07695 [bacterium]|nr:hypothetical protein [Deltaproteobacteria bacterium]MCP4904848.1 hypothetical protein [bacterium]
MALPGKGELAAYRDAGADRIVALGMLSNAEPMILEDTMSPVIRPSDPPIMATQCMKTSRRPGR